MEYILAPLAFVLAVMLARPFFIAMREQHEAAVKAHKANLRKGGLIAQVTPEIHKEALREILAESPNINLPRRTIVK